MPSSVRASSVSSISTPRSRTRADEQLDLELDDLGDVLAAEPVEDHGLVDPVQELGLEGCGEHVVDPLADRLVDLLGGDLLRADVRGHDQDRVREVDRPALAVGQAAVVHDLQQHVEDVGVRLLDLVEQDHRVGAPAHRLGQLPALVVADVAGRRADQARDRVLLHVLGHVDADDRLLGVEHELGQRPRQLGLADAGRAEEQEAADRPVRVGEAGPRAAQRVGDGLDRLVLADHAVVEALLHLDQLLDLALEQTADRDPGPLADDLGDVLARSTSSVSIEPPSACSSAQPLLVLAE